MKAALLIAPGRFEIRDVPEPEIGSPFDALLRVAAVGVCGSDLHYFRRGRIGSQVVEHPWIVGHECSATVVKVGSEVQGLRPSDRVAVDPLVSCGECDQCCAGRRHTCRRQRFLGCPGQIPGALAEFLVMPAECCARVPDSLSATEAALIEPFSVGLYAVRLAHPEPGQSAAVLGSGPIGLSVLLACRTAGIEKLYATDLVPERLAAARTLGAVWAGNPREMNVLREILAREAGGLDVVFECAGEQETLDQALELLRPGGKLAIVGIPESDRVSFSIDLLRRKELAVLNVRRQNRMVEPAIELVVSRKVDLLPLATHHFALAETQAAFELVEARGDGVVKALIHLSDSH